MNKRTTAILSGLALLCVVAACSKLSNPYYGPGSTPTLVASTATAAPTAADSLNVALVLNWTNPHYSIDSASELYTIQFDSAGHNFVTPVSIAVTGALTDSIKANWLNTLVLGLGGNFNVPYTLEFRLVSSYGNNNEQLISGTLTLTYTPYVTPPNVVPPVGGLLYLVGAATQGGWGTPVPVPTQVFAQVDSVDFAGVFNLIGGQQYLVLPAQNFNDKFAVLSADDSVSGGTFQDNNLNGSYGTNFTGPATSGWYVIWLNFQTGIFTVTPALGAVPDSMYIIGSATAGGWDNPVPYPSQAMTQINSAEFQVTLPLSAGGAYVFLPTNTDSWVQKWASYTGSDTVSGGVFGWNPNTNLSVGYANDNITGPANAGTYTITADFINWEYIVTQ